MSGRLSQHRGYAFNVFISWSGSTSKAVATAIHSWIPLVLQSVKPWMSSADVAKGARWSSDLASQLEGTCVVIICLTSEDLEAPWIMFEAGVLSKTLDSPFVCPYLFNVDPAALKGPLVQFQAARSDMEDTRRLVRTINHALKERALPEKQLDDTFDIWWPKLHACLELVRHTESNRPAAPVRGEQDLLEEILDLVRDLVRRDASADKRLVLPSRSASANDLTGSLEEAASLLRGTPSVAAEQPSAAGLTERLPRLLTKRLTRKNLNSGGYGA